TWPRRRPGSPARSSRTPATPRKPWTGRWTRWTWPRASRRDSGRQRAAVRFSGRFAFLSNLAHCLLHVATEVIFRADATSVRHRLDGPAWLRGRPPVSPRPPTVRSSRPRSPPRARPWRRALSSRGPATRNAPSGRGALAEPSTCADRNDDPLGPGVADEQLESFIGRRIPK